ncbi:MAG: WYL domain-containing protein [Lachnospiraceae bacterium]|nr:WYL domain-containing protein [Lachnospiraceae bacterium]
MTEKYKVYVAEDLRSRLANDAELFEFFKKDGSVNLNAFLKELLVNYFDEYLAKKEALQRTILADLGEFPKISKRDAEAIADKIINIYMKRDDDVKSPTCAVTLTVSGRSLDVMRTIENNLLADKSLSQFVGDLFASYLSVARSGRERIIFRDTFDTLNEAIRDHSIVTFKSASARNLLFEIEPYIIAASKEEQCNYLLCTDTHRGLLRTFRISRIQTLYKTSKTFPENEKIRGELQEIALRNPQSASKNVAARVRLTDRGIEKFQVIVKNRPEVERKEGNLYYFNWPAQQLEDYFQRFGQDAVIEAPARSHATVRAFYEKALAAYT